MNYDEVETILGDLGFIRTRISGSHVVFRSPFDGTSFSIPKQGGQFVSRVYLNLICEELGLDGIDLDEYLASVARKKAVNHD